VHKLEVFKLQGQDEISSEKLLDDARMLEEAGCFSIVLEMIPAELAKENYGLY